MNHIPALPISHPFLNSDTSLIRRGYIKASLFRHWISPTLNFRLIRNWRILCLKLLILKVFVTSLLELMVRLFNGSISTERDYPGFSHKAWEEYSTGIINQSNSMTRNLALRNSVLSSP